MALGDIGKHFPDTCNIYKDISSIILMEKVYELMLGNGYEIGNVDSVIVAQRPKFAKYIDAMRENIAKALHTSVDNISVKATTTEELGFEGREEGISAESVCILNEKRK